MMDSQIKRNILLILNQIISCDKIMAIIDNDSYCLRVYEMIEKKQYDRLSSIIPNILKHKDQVNTDFLKKQNDLSNKLNIKIVTTIDMEYPVKLRNLFQIPPVLYIRNELKNCPSIGIVGTRKSTYYGRNVTEKLVSELIAKGIGIISGMAYGIDYYAHSFCLLNEGYTIGVLGTGLDIVYPSQNRKLYDMILEKGSCLISEFPLNYGPTKYSFLQRNRIISGLSDGIIVIESKERGGALATANFALEQGKDVFSVPGSIFSPQSQGCNNLIKKGAIPVTQGDDILFSIKDIINYNYSEQETKSLENSISNKEKEILELLDQGIVLFDCLMDKLNMDIGNFYNLLFDLEKKGYIRRDAGNKYIRIHS